MKMFNCGDVVPGCKATFRANDEQHLFAQIKLHAEQEHGLTEIPPALLTRVRGLIQDVSIGL